MPSLHFGWTLMFGVLFLRTHNRWLKILGVLYPVLTLVAITITANHYLMDAVGAVLLMVAAFVTLEIVVRRRLFLPRIGAFVQSFAVGHRSWAFLKEGIKSSGTSSPAKVTGSARQNQEAGVGPIR